MTTLELKPYDLLFFRDGRPMDVDRSQDDYFNVGHGSQWPRPDHFYNAIMHAVIGRGNSEREYGKHGDLRTAGPFPIKNKTLYFPRPLDWKMKVGKLGKTDLPDWLTYGFYDCDATKKDYPAWITASEMSAYLNGGCPDLGKPEDEVRKLYTKEVRVGNTLDVTTGASAKSIGMRGTRYTAEYLRFEKGVSMWAAVDMGKEKRSAPRQIIMGGQGGVVELTAQAQKTLSEIFPLPTVTGDGEKFVRWTLLSPAYFPETGWLPSFCKDTRKDVADGDRAKDGTVMYNDVEGVSLVGACTGKPIAYSGYDTLDGVKPTRLVIPAGSVYLFKCEDAAGATSLINKLHLTARSQNNNQGFGIGVCSVVSVS